jgi:hypothetical protein
MQLPTSHLQDITSNLVVLTRPSLICTHRHAASITLLRYDILKYVLALFWKCGAGAGFVVSREFP